MNMFRLRDPYRFSLVTGRGCHTQDRFPIGKGKQKHWKRPMISPAFPSLPRTPCAHPVKREVTICLASDIDWLLEVGHSRPIKKALLIATVDWHHALKFCWLLMVASMCQVTAGGVLWVSQLSLENVVHVTYIDIDLHSYHFKGTCQKYAAHWLEISGFSQHIGVFAVDLIFMCNLTNGLSHVHSFTIEDWKKHDFPEYTSLHFLLRILWQAVFF